jgi:hypothetical protein
MVRVKPFSSSLIVFFSHTLLPPSLPSSLPPSGKTAAFIIPCLEKTDVTKNHIQSTYLPSLPSSLPPCLPPSFTCFHHSSYPSLPASLPPSQS